MGEELFILFTAHAFRKMLSIYVFSYFPFGFDGRIFELIVSVPDHCLSFYFVLYAELRQIMIIFYLKLVNNNDKTKKT